MPLGTLDRTPPSFFRQGPSALSKLIFFSALALFLMVADVRFRMLEPLRAAVTVALLPVQRTLAVPLDILQGGSTYMQGLAAAEAEVRTARRTLVAQSELAARAEVLAQENERLRGLLDLSNALQVRTIAAEVMFEAADPFSRKVFIDRGQAQGVVVASPVINENGVLGQVTRVFPLSAEVTLMTDREFAIPVLNMRTRQRSVAFGGASSTHSSGTQGGIELRFMSGNADVQEGDMLQTGGLDGVYPPGLAVARVLKVERRAEGGFARVSLAPAATSDGVRHVLVLEPQSLQLPPVPAAASAAGAQASERKLTTPRREATP
jgi:rod shape-determining protein MreC